ncbi:hypothetical protein PIB30_110394 [Stylosanthes scabra]|uniref:Uncharacterized protein n=1 Tax=Stylosanthes scabra TaxID=79078 RepID=A0ABU6X0W5_9FABA|nr:hypothetical protein [Stylosanthes scabra]
MRDEDVRAEDIIADKIVRMAQGIKEKGKLGFPSTVFKLCKEAGRRQQENEDEDEPMPQVEEGNEGQAHDYDYHHQPEYEHHQPDYEQLIARKPFPSYIKELLRQVNRIK